MCPVNIAVVEANGGDQRECREEAESGLDLTVPGPSDVICGKDMKVTSHSGNKVFRKIVAMNAQRYANAPTKEERVSLVRSIVARIRESGGRFLKEEDNSSGEFYDIGDGKAREKTRHALRFAGLNPKTSGSANKSGSILSALAPQVSVTPSGENWDLLNRMANQIENGSPKPRPYDGLSSQEGYRTRALVPTYPHESEPSQKRRILESDSRLARFSNLLDAKLRGSRPTTMQVMHHMGHKIRELPLEKEAASSPFIIGKPHPMFVQSPLSAPATKLDFKRDMPMEMNPYASFNAAAAASVSPMPRHLQPSPPSPSMFPARAASSPPITTRNTSNFPQKLMAALLIYEESQKHIWRRSEPAFKWLNGGNSFLVLCEATFFREVLVEYGLLDRYDKYSSFVRALNRWGFTSLRCGLELSAFHHALFRKGQFDMCKRMKPVLKTAFPTMSSPEIGFGGTVAVEKLGSNVRRLSEADSSSAAKRSHSSMESLSSASDSSSD